MIVSLKKIAHDILPSFCMKASMMKWWKNLPSHMHKSALEIHRTVRKVTVFGAGWVMGAVKHKNVTFPFCSIDACGFKLHNTTNYQEL